MKHTAKILTAILAGTMFSGNAFAGNQDRAGQAGATELLINPWADDIADGELIMERETPPVNGQWA